MFLSDNTNSEEKLMKISTVILAAGQGTRMVSDLPKVLHPLNGKPLILYAIDTAAAISSEKPVVVIGNGAEKVREVVGDKATFALQEKRLGTAHAVLSAEGCFKDYDGLILVIAADMPLLTRETLQRMVDDQLSSDSPMTMVTVRLQDSHGFGRILRGMNGEVREIIEEAHASPDELQIDECNVGAYCFKSAWLWEVLKRIKLSPKGEYYLTDLVAVAVMERKQVNTILLTDKDEALGINNRVHLAEAEVVVRRRLNREYMLAGVSMINPEQVYIEGGVKIGKDTLLQPGTYLKGKTTIGERCEIGPNTIIDSSSIGNECKLLASVIEGAVIEDYVGMGPFCHLRKGAHLGSHVHMGNFGEVKDSHLAAGVKMGHFSYIGNAEIGENVNIGAGTITCNFDGEHKHPTVIGADAFIGSDTMLVAPVKIGKGARTGAGSVVTHDVPDGDVVVGVPARKLKGT
jgi:bifunctional UDP-N-acetylglucosamine pyrophosphorylase / glucosamine-1-phosphate N-acetyltransferase